MVQAGRFACIFTPFVLSLASLVCLILVFLGGTSEHNTTLGSFYFLKLNLTDFTLNGALANTGLSSGELSALTDALQNAKQELNLKDFYIIHLWNYCAWNGADLYAYCSPKTAEFWFNPIEVWSLNSTGVIDINTLLPQDLRDGLNTYQTVSKYMFIFYVAALVATCLTILVGLSALFSRWGSFATTFFSTTASLFTIVASILATVLFITLKTAIDDALKNYDINATLGQPMLFATWLAVAFALAAGLFWLFSICCCSGRSPYKGREDARTVKVEKAPYTYERVGSPYFGPKEGQAVPLANMPDSRHTAYEPFRPQQV